ncbi:MAG: FtsQ-type POTRA domain-containing protein [Thermoleophilia bacterium]|nr:FtsQ-type POTRA domain-containing protein [Thermoleophilia bacterium]
MSRRVAVALAAVRPRSLPDLRSLFLACRPSRRFLIGAGVLAAACPLSYALARETPLFSVSGVEVSGVPKPVAAAIRESLQPLAGESLVALDPDEVEARLRTIPSVRDVAVDRSFPHTLSVRARAEEPLAVIRNGERGWLVARNGRVMQEIRPRARAHLPRIRTRPASSPVPGTKLTSSDGRAALAVLRAVPPKFPLRILYVRGSGAELVLVVEGWMHLRLGSVAALGRKLAAAAAVLASLSPEERDAVSYLDVSVPGRVVAGSSAKPKSDGLGLREEGPAKVGD